MKQLKLFAFIMILSTNTHAANPTSNLSFSGSLTAENTCGITVDSGSLLEVGVRNAFDLVPGVIIDKMFNALITCSYPTVIGVKYTSSLPTDSNWATELGIYKTSVNQINAINLYAVLLPSSPPTSNGSNYVYASIGDTTLIATGTFNPTLYPNGYRPISGISGTLNNMFTVTNNNIPLAAINFTLPFKVGLSTHPLSGWLNDISGISMPLNATITLELHTI